MGMTTDDQSDVEAIKDWHEVVSRRQTGKEFIIAAWCGMAKQHLAQAANLDTQGCRPAGEQAHVFRLKLVRHPADYLSNLFW
jgi:hypothetical protein